MSTNILNPFEIFGQSWTPADLNEPNANLLVDMPLWDSTRLFQGINENTIGKVPDEADTDGDLVGAIVDAGSLSVSWGETELSSQATRRATLSTKDGRPCLKFNGDDTISINADYNMGHLLFENIWASNSDPWSFQFWVQKADNGINELLCGNMLVGSTASDFGIDIYINTSNQVAIRVACGTGTYQIDINTVQTVVVADGWVPISIVKSGVGVDQLLIDIDGVQETFDVQNQEASGAASWALRTAWRNEWATFYLGGLRMWDIAIDSSEITSWQSYNPARSNTVGGYCETWDIDLNDNSQLFTDLGKTTNPTDGQTIKVINGNKKQDNTYRVIRELTEDTVGASWVASGQGGKGESLFASGENYSLSDVGLNSSGVGSATYLIIGKNTDSTLGSHFFSSANGYYVQTGENYVGNPTGDPYGVLHMGNEALQFDAVDTVNDYFIVVARVIGTTDGQKGWDKELNTYTDDMANALGAIYSDVGKAMPAIGSAWDLTGNLLKIQKWNGTLTDEDCENLITYYKNFYEIN